METVEIELLFLGRHLCAVPGNVFSWTIKYHAAYKAQWGSQLTCGFVGKLEPWLTKAEYLLFPALLFPQVVGCFSGWVGERSGDWRRHRETSGLFCLFLVATEGDLALNFLHISFKRKEFDVSVIGIVFMLPLPLRQQSKSSLSTLLFTWITLRSCKIFYHFY